ncbi:adenosine A2a receptor a [Hypanus sabinus]|uniref:adenosine A2a receptor a n=1 Tax=Hypanus sabinus TaxID=79690 RepID=UPI0028C38261|nr:adenosine A2a receptor a [Hypanus sabinus]XP_059839320.1 adenosine A2a receptor a [Hypanus sabinus]XP_059839321.1 adenosine A2a receptor a [Hypanus sabinus]XP_059839322.1 adenosine A2a receptor a [Hypanus sabinus]XP_059839323.1 adenosine A2a receptor a [Hypanus sabinus]XP_059839324.1 adenosine A2a receptor a [Hypanus sabinus]
MQVMEEQVCVKVMYIAMELLIAVLAVLGNVLVCWAVYLNSNLQSITNFFVVSLAVADIAVGVLAIPFAITISTGFCSLFYGCLFIACFVVVLTQSSIFSLLAIAVDRYICIKIPLRYNSLVTGSRARGVICICWVLSFFIGLTPIFGWNNSSHNVTVNGSCGDGFVSCLFEEVVTMDYMVYYNFFACVLLPLILMLGIYLRIFMAARHQLKQMDFSSLPTERSRSTLQKEVQAAKSLAIIVGLFAACWLPVHIINCVTFFCEDCRPPAGILYFAIILSHANSVVNPFIYAYRIREFRQTFRKILKRYVLRKTEQTFTRQNTRSSIHTSGDHVNLHINGCGLDLLTNASVEAAGVADKDTSQHQNLLARRPSGTSPGDSTCERVLSQGQHLPEERDLNLHTAFPHQAS